MDEVVSNILNYKNYLIIIAAWSLVLLCRKTFPKFFTEGFGIRVLPILPTVFSSTGVWMISESGWREKVLMGLVLGTITANGHQILKRLGITDKIPGLRPGDRGIPNVPTGPVKATLPHPLPEEEPEG